MLRPPKDVPPEVLFRRLLGVPRPTLPLKRRIPGAEDVALSVQAIAGHEYTGSRLDVVTAALLADGRKAFSSIEQAEALPSSVADGLADDVLEALSQCSPIYGISNLGQWSNVLIDGAGHPSNVAQAMSLGAHVEVHGKLLLDRPALYFGIPAAQLIDAHWFAFRAAKSHYLQVVAK